MDKRTLKRAVEFHGHLGPYLVLGILAGEAGIERTGAGKHFGLEVKVYGAGQRPRSCLIDGLQLSTGATFGKGNIRKARGRGIRIEVRNLKNNKQAEISLKPSLLKGLSSLNGHKDSEAFARRLARAGTRGRGLFQIK